MAFGASALQFATLATRMKTRARVLKDIVSGAAEGLHPFTVGAASSIDIFGDGSGTNEAYRRNIGMLKDGINRYLVTMDNVKDAFWTARLL